MYDFIFLKVGYMKKYCLFIIILMLSTPLYADNNSQGAPLTNIQDYPEDLSPVIKAINSGNYENALKEIEALAPVIKTNKKGKKKIITKDVPPEKKKYLKGIALLKLGKFAEAKQALKESLALRGSNGDTVAELAFANLALGEYDKALQNFKEALWLDNMKEHSPADIYYQIGFIYQSKDDTEVATENYKKALDINNTHIMSSIKLAELSFANGEKKRAVKLLRHLCEKGIATNEAKRLLATMLLTNVDPLIDGSDIKYALEIIKPIFESSNKDTHYKDPAFPVYIKALLLSDELNTAEEEIQLALKKDKNNPNLQRLIQQIELEKSAQKPAN